MKILHLTLKKEPFDVMIIGEKVNEYRKYTPWLKSRLYYPDMRIKEYDIVRFKNGYKKDSPAFDVEYNYFEFSPITITHTYSSGFTFTVKKNDICIHLGKVLKTYNIK